MSQIFNSRRLKQRERRVSWIWYWAILDRESLKLAASGFYGVPEAEYARSMGAGRGRNPNSIPAFPSTQPEIL